MIEVAFPKEGFATASAAVPIADHDSVADDIRGIFVRRAAAIGLAIPKGDGQEALSHKTRVEISPTSDRVYEGIVIW
jgi:hypothetical protein